MIYIVNIGNLYADWQSGLKHFSITPVVIIGVDIYIYMCMCVYCKYILYIHMDKSTSCISQTLFWAN